MRGVWSVHLEVGTKVVTNGATPRLLQFTTDFPTLMGCTITFLGMPDKMFDNMTWLRAGEMCVAREILMTSVNVSNEGLTQIKYLRLRIRTK